MADTTAESPGELSGIDARLFPDTIAIALAPEATGVPTERLRPLWHEAPKLPGTVLTISSQDTRPRFIELSVVSDAPEWQGRWIRWSYAVREAPELQGGDAVSAQDILTPDGDRLTLLVLPDESRDAVLEITACLDGMTPTGDFPFSVVLTDTHDGTAASLSGMLSLRHPRSMLTERLPSMYAEEMDNLALAEGQPHNRPFFERYLTGFDDASQPMKELIDNLYRFFDPFETPPDFLPWLATWVGMAVDQKWPEMKRRKLIREAVELYRWRGTRRGLSRYLEIYAGVRPEINDTPFRGMRLGPTTLLGTDLSDPAKVEQNTVLGDVPQHSFVVTVAAPDPTTIDEATVHDIIQMQKPAHTAYTARIVRRAPTEE